MSENLEVPQDFISQIFYRLKQVKLDINPIVENAIRMVPRELFVPEKLRNQAYLDRPLPIASSQTISAPHMYAMMMAIQAGDPGKNMNILEIGAGSGYGAALLGYIVGEGGKVTSIERHEKLVNFARNNIASANITNVTILQGNGTKEIPDELFDRIIVTAAGSSLPPIYPEHLKTGGRIVIPLADFLNDQWIWVMTKEDDGTLKKKRLLQVAFVPLVF